MLFNLTRQARPFALGVMLFIMLATTHAYAESNSTVPVALIVNASVPISSLKRITVHSIFTRKLVRWEDGSRIQVFVLPDDDPLHRRFAKDILGIFPYQLRQVWDRITFAGIEQAPEVVNSQAEMIERVRETPGAIGYTDAQIQQDGVHYVSVD